MPASRDADRLKAAPIAIRRWERWLPRTIGALAVVLSLFLAAMLWFVQRSVDRASRVLVQGEAVQLADATRDTLRGLGRPPRAEDLAALLEQEEPRGLRYVALLTGDRGTSIEVEAGKPITPVDRADLAALTPMDPVRIDDRVRLLAGPPQRGRPGGPGFPGPGGPPPFGRPPPRPDGPDVSRLDRAFPRGPEGPPPFEEPEFGEGPPPRGPPGALRFRHAPPPIPPRILLEFVPVRAAELTALAARTSWLAMLAIPAFLGGALLLIQLVRQREDLTKRVEHDRRLAALGEMTAVIAHEIRNPLASLKGHAQLLERSLAGDAREAKADLVVGEAVRLEDLVSDLLDFSRTGTLQARASDPALVLRESAESIDPDRIVLDVARAPKTWRLDPPRLRQALGNVLRNAVQASPEGAFVDAAVFCEDDHLVFEVRDRGPGIPAGEEERIFEPFHTRKTRGTGLGLPLVRRIVEQHGGTVHARNEAAGGALLRIALPRA